MASLRPLHGFNMGVLKGFCAERGSKLTDLRVWGFKVQDFGFGVWGFKVQDFRNPKP